MTDETSDTIVLELAAELTVAWLSNPNTKVPPDELPAVIGKIHAALAGLSASAADQELTQPEYTPAVTVRRSLASKDHILSMIDGKPFKMLKRHLSKHGLTPAQYRERYSLKPDYPMVAEAYAAKRSDLAKRIGRGRKAGHAVEASRPTNPGKPRRSKSAE